MAYISVGLRGGVEAKLLTLCSLRLARSFAFDFLSIDLPRRLPREIPGRHFLGIKLASVPDGERYIIDSNIFDEIIDEPGMLERVRRLTASGAISLVSTPTQRDELASVRDPERRERLLEVTR